jgi:hypothetical protein
LSQQRYDPNAKRGYELLSGGFTWSDEIPRSQEVSDLLYKRLCWFMQPIYAYRASLIRGEPDERFRQCWQDIERDCPAWPALRSERYSPDLRSELDEETERQVAYVERELDKCERAERIARIRKQKVDAKD